MKTDAEFISEAMNYNVTKKCLNNTLTLFDDILDEQYYALKSKFFICRIKSRLFDVCVDHLILLIIELPYQISNIELSYDTYLQVLLYIYTNMNYESKLVPGI